MFDPLKYHRDNCAAGEVEEERFHPTSSALSPALFSHLHYEGVRPMVLALDDQASHHNSMRGGLAHAAWPPLGASQRGRVNDKLLCGQGVRHRMRKKMRQQAGQCISLDGADKRTPPKALNNTRWVMMKTCHAMTRVCEAITHLLLCIIGGSCLQAPDKGAMPQLCLRVRADDLQDRTTRQSRAQAPVLRQPVAFNPTPWQPLS